MQCILCNEEANWVRYTQFAGTHPFCDKHARKEEDFCETSSYSDWEELFA
jgi:hypothetical protein